jgi:hypothetical protein
MPEQLDQTSEQVAGHLREARDLLSETERILAMDTTDQHRTQWPNVYRLESATQLAQRTLTWADPRITPEAVANELVNAARQARDVIREAVTTGGGSLIDAAEGLLKVIAQFGPQLPPSEEEANAALARLNEVQGEIDDAKGRIGEQITKIAAEVDGKREQTFAAMADAAEAVKARREAADQQASELGLLTSSIAAENLADVYAKDAKRTERQASNYTWASLAVGILSVAVTAAGLLTVKEPSSFETVIAHAAYGLPVALLAAYVNSLASTHRREAWRLRHIELQIRTANPFLGLLDDARRKETLAALALRFFPGQEGVSFDGKGSAELTPELIDLLRKVLQQQGASSANASSMPVGTAQTPDRPAET